MHGDVWLVNGIDDIARFDGAQEHFKPYNQFMGFMQNTPSASNPYPFAPIAQPVGAQDWTNSVQWSTRLRLNMGMTINENAKIMGRLAMYKVAGGGSVVVQVQARRGDALYINDGVYGSLADAGALGARDVGGVHPPEQLRRLA